LLNEELTDSHHLDKRHILEDKGKTEEKEAPKFIKSDCVSVYFSGLKLGVSKTELTEILGAVDNSTTAEGQCNGTDAS